MNDGVSNTSSVICLFRIVTIGIICKPNGYIKEIKNYDNEYGISNIVLH